MEVALRGKFVIEDAQVKRRKIPNQQSHFTSYGAVKEQQTKSKGSREKSRLERNKRTEKQ